MDCTQSIKEHPAPAGKANHNKNLAWTWTGKTVRNLSKNIPHLREKQITTLIQYIYYGSGLYAIYHRTSRTCGKSKSQLNLVIVRSSFHCTQSIKEHPAPAGKANHNRAACCRCRAPTVRNLSKNIPHLREKQITTLSFPLIHAADCTQSIKEHPAPAGKANHKQRPTTKPRTCTVRNLSKNIPHLREKQITTNHVSQQNSCCVSLSNLHFSRSENMILLRWLVFMAFHNLKFSSKLSKNFIPEKRCTLTKG